MTVLLGHMGNPQGTDQYLFFAGGGFVALFFGMGAAQYLKEIGHLPERIYAESGGSAGALLLVHPNHDIQEQYFYWCKQCRKMNRSVLSSNWNEVVGSQFGRFLNQADDLYERANKHIFLSITQDFRHSWKSYFANNEDLCSSMRASSHVPFYNYAPEFGLKKIDGYFTWFMRKLPPQTIRIGFAGDIAPTLRVGWKDVFIYDPQKTPTLYADGYLQARAFFEHHGIPANHSEPTNVTRLPIRQKMV